MNRKVKEVTEPREGVVCDYCRKSEVNSLEWGPMYQLDGINVHYFCMLFSAGLSQNGDDEEGILGFLPKDIRRELNRGNNLKCKFCLKSRATIGCSVRNCKISYHFPCGLEEDSVFQFIGNFESYCSKHRERILIPLKRTGSEWECPICFTDVTKEDSPLWPPCCKKRVFHKTCIMKMAKNHGAHFFKCPLCNDRDIFSVAMRKAGVYLPDRDATWEMEPNAFGEHSRLYSRCDAKKCICPDGREHDDKDDSLPWKVVRCGACGASAIHTKCGNLKNLTWRCQTCAEILSRKTSGDSARIQRVLDSSDEEDDLFEPVIQVKDVVRSHVVNYEIDSHSGKKNVYDSTERRKRKHVNGRVESDLSTASSTSDDDDIFVSIDSKTYQQRRKKRSKMVIPIKSRSPSSTTSSSSTDSVHGKHAPGQAPGFLPFSKRSLIKNSAKGDLNQVCRQVCPLPTPIVLTESKSYSVKMFPIGNESESRTNNNATSGHPQVDPDSSAHNDDKVEEINLDSDSSDVEIVQESIFRPPRQTKSAAVLELINRTRASNPRPNPNPPMIRLGVDDDQIDDLEFTGRNKLHAYKPPINFGSARNLQISTTFLSIIQQAANPRHNTVRLQPKNSDDCEVIELLSDEETNDAANAQFSGTSGSKATSKCAG